MSSPLVIKDRYEVKAVLGRGGMGVVYQAFDRLMRREVAVKTLRDVPSSVFTDLFYRECSVLAAMVHPNVVEIFDMGEFQEEEVSKPYFVMPLLPGCTLYDLIYPAALPLSVNRCVDIICQACRGLQAAHERGLLHRDIKPRNIFVMNDDAVKIIDFGVAQLMGNNSTGVRGTPQYMSPEQITFKSLNNRSDIFSLATVCYEALTAVHPFLRDPERRDSDVDIADAITSHIPPVASELNPGVSRAVAQVVAKGMAKEPWSRFESAASFADALQKAVRNEGATALNLSSVRLRLERAKRSFEQKDYQFASEIVSELEADGYSDAEIVQIRRELDEAVRRERTDRLLEAAGRCFAGEEYTLALRKVQEILQIDPANSAALDLKKKIEDLLTGQRVAELLRVAAEHLEQSAFTNARQAIKDALKLRPNDTRAREFLNEVDSKQKELLRQHQEQERLYQMAQAGWLQGNIEAAVANLDQLAQLTRQFTDARERVSEYKEFHKRVREEHEAVKSSLDQGRKLLFNADLAGAQRICDRYLTRYPGHEGFVTLSRDIERQRREEAAAYRASIAERVRAEHGLETRVEILEGALKKRPDEEYFRQEIREVREKQEQVSAVVEKARDFERQQNFKEAIQEWESLREIYPQYPRLEELIARATAALRRQRVETKADFAKRIKHALEEENEDLAGHLLREAELAFPSDEELRELQFRKNKQVERVAQVSSLLAKASRSFEQKQFQEGLAALNQSAELSRDLQKLGKKVFDAVLEHARRVVGEDWRTAQLMLKQAAQLGSNVQVPPKLWAEVRHREREEQISNILNEAAAYESGGRLQEASERLTRAIEDYRGDARLEGRLRSVETLLAEERRKEERESCLRTLTRLHDDFQKCEDPDDIEQVLARCQSAAGPYASDPNFSSVLTQLAEQVSTYQQASAAFANDDINECLEICDLFLSRTPGQRLFVNLRAQAEARERGKAAEYLERTMRRVAAQPGLEERAEILQEALREYPNELHFREELSLVRNEQNLVNAVAQRAEKLEKEGSFVEALEQWTHLNTIYPTYPGLEEAITRCTRLLEEKREQAIAAYVWQVQEAIDNRAYALAYERLKKAQLDFPEEEKLAALGEHLEERRQIRYQAEQLLKQGRADMEAGRIREGREGFREALQLTAGEDDIAKSVAKFLIQYSRQALRVDLRLAESMIEDAYSADPAAKIPNALRSALSEARKRGEFESCSQSVRSFEATDDFVGALRRVGEFLAKYPGDKQAEALKARLMIAEQEAKKRQERAHLFEELSQVEDQTKTVVHRENLLDLLKRTQGIARKSSGDEEVTRVAERVGEILSALSQVRDLIDQERLEEAQELCGRNIARFPQHPGFVDLRSQIELRQNARAADYLGQVEHELAQEHDLEKQAAVLEAAIERYPNENYYTEQLQRVRNEQGVLDAEIKRAREFESGQLYEDALREWETLRGRYPWLPNVDGEIQRVSQRSIAKKAEVREHWIERIRRASNSGDDGAAAQLMQQALSELPEDPRLGALNTELSETRQKLSTARDFFARGGELLRTGQSDAASDCFQQASQLGNEQLRSSIVDLLTRHAEALALELLAQGDDLLSTGQFEAACDCFHRASELGNPVAGLLEHNTRLRSSIVNLLMQHAEALINENWEASGALLKLVAQLDPTYPLPAQLSDAVRSKGRQNEIDRLLVRVSEAESNGNWREAARLLQSGRSMFPDEPRMEQRTQAVAAAIQREKLERIRADALNEMEQIRSQLQAITARRRLRSLRSSFLSKGFVDSADPTIHTAAADVLARFEARLETIEQTPSKVRFSLQRLKTTRTRWFAIAALVLLTSTSSVFWLARKPSLRTVDLAINPANVFVSVNGYSCTTPNCKIKLSPGNYGVRIAKNGYEPQIIPLTINAQPEIAPRITAALMPLPPAIQITGNLDSGEVYLDDRRIGSLKGTELRIPSIGPGAHVVKVSAGAREASLAVKASADGRAIVSGPVLGKDLELIAISEDGKASRLATSVQTPRPVYVDGKRVGVTDAGSLGLPNLREGTHNIQIGEGRDLLKFDVPVHRTPQLYAFVIGNQEVGTLVASTNVKDAELLIDDERHTGPANDGRFRIALPSKTYTVRATREGYIPSNSVRVSIKRGSETALNIRLNPKPGFLQVRGAAPGTSVKVDGSLAGVVSNSRFFTHSLTPGDHVIELSRNGFSSKRLQRRFGPGETIPLVGSDVDLAPIVPDASALEVQDWNRVSGTRNASELQQFLQKYPNGSHVGAANQTLQQIQWDAADKKSSSSLEAFLNKYPEGPHSSQARELLGTLEDAEKRRAEENDWKATDKSSREALRSFLAKHPNGPHYDSAQQAMSDLKKREDAAELERSEEAAWISVNVKDREALENFLKQFPSGKHHAQAESALQTAGAPQISSADSSAILSTLQRFASAWNAKDTDAIVSLQPSLNRKSIKATVTSARSIRMTITPQSTPQIIGDKGTVLCRRTFGAVFQDGTEKQGPESIVQFTLSKRSGTWVIESTR